MDSTSSSDPGMKAKASGGENSETVIANDQLLLCRGLKKAKKERGCTAKERISKMPPCTAGKRSSIYRGVTSTGKLGVKLQWAPIDVFDNWCLRQLFEKRNAEEVWEKKFNGFSLRHRWTGRYEAHLWDKSTWNQNQNKKGKQGTYDEEEAAARAYDLAALKYWGPGTLINFPVTDYTRDLEEMENVSREDYLASLRRKSSGFSRGISKYRGLSRKIDLTGYIKWWGTNKTHQAEAGAKSSEETKHACPEDFGGELKTSEWAVQPTEPYQMPCLGTSLEGTKRKGSSVSALSILSLSADFKSLQERALKKQGHVAENENKNTINKMDLGKAAEKSVSHDTGSGRLEATMVMSGGLSLQKNVFPSTPFLSAPLFTNYNAIDSLVDPVLWTSLVPVLPTGPSHNPEFMSPD
ncbi:AP2-like ethylene-responsive transcription factor [Hibiscus syriacus]|uniref:AP2-like ethylene-responsive transcription factor n=1 Tax=Hibiscus syriacus TaxID=106335 RepID=A0A6A2ZLC2_HIBSY|nr:AP2-like ethylene-responsive transcription factor [Hibiscus syriacus]